MQSFKVLKWPTIFTRQRKKCGLIDKSQTIFPWQREMGATLIDQVTWTSLSISRENSFEVKSVHFLRWNDNHSKPICIYRPPEILNKLIKLLFCQSAANNQKLTSAIQEEGAKPLCGDHTDYQHRSSKILLDDDILANI